MSGMAVSKVYIASLLKLETTCNILLKNSRYWYALIIEDRYTDQVKNRMVLRLLHVIVSPSD